MTYHRNAKPASSRQQQERRSQWRSHRPGSRLSSCQHNATSKTNATHIVKAAAFRASSLAAVVLVYAVSVAWISRKWLLENEGISQQPPYRSCELGGRNLEKRTLPNKRDHVKGTGVVWISEEVHDCKSVEYRPRFSAGVQLLQHQPRRQRENTFETHGTVDCSIMMLTSYLLTWPVSR